MIRCRNMAIWNFSNSWKLVRGSRLMLPIEPFRKCFLLHGIAEDRSINHATILSTDAGGRTYTGHIKWFYILSKINKNKHWTANLQSRNSKHRLSLSRTNYFNFALVTTSRPLMHYNLHHRSQISISNRRPACCTRLSNRLHYMYLRPKTNYLN